MWSGRASRVPGGRAEQSCRSSPKSGKKVKELLLFAPVSTKAKLGACKNFYIRNSDAHKSKMQNIGKEQSYP